MAEVIEDPLRRRQYANPPVIEAIARFRWSDPVAWNLTTPGLLLAQLSDLYGGEPRSQAIVQAGMFIPGGTSEAGGGIPEGGQSSGFQLRTAGQRIIFSAEGRPHQLGVSAEDISVHGTQPYEGWESLEQRLLVGVERVNKALNRKEPTYSQVGLRYVNRVEIQEEALRFEDYLTISFSFPNGFPPVISGFLDRAEMQYPDENVGLAFTWASTEAAAGWSAFIVDLDLVASLPEPVDLERAREVLRDLKIKEGRAFEGLLQDRLREQFVEIG